MRPRGTLPRMVPLPHEVARWRALAAGFLRIGGLLLSSFCLVPMLSWLAEGLRDGDLLDFS